MNDSNNWWTLENVLLVHAINCGGRPKGHYEKDGEKPIPESGELSCSISSPITMTTYASEGLILRPTTPNRLSYTDVGSFYPESSDHTIEPRTVQGKVWTPEQMSMENLIYLTLTNGGYNEVLVSADKTAIIGVYGPDEKVDDFVNDITTCMNRTDIPDRAKFAGQVFSTTLLQSNFYVHFPRGIHNNKVRWDMMDKLRSGREGAGYNTKEVGTMRYITEDLAADKIIVEQLLGNTDPLEVYGGEFRMQPITESHKELLLSKGHK